MQATSNGTIQTQTHRSHGVGSNLAEGDLQQVPSGLMGEILSNLTCGEQAVAMSTAPASLRDRVAPHIPEPSVANLEVEFQYAAIEGRLDEVQALLDRYQAANIPEQTKYACICRALDGAIKAGHLSIVRYMLSNLQLSQQQLTGRLFTAVSRNQPEIFRAVAGYVDFSEMAESNRNMLSVCTRENSEMFRVFTEVMGPCLTDEEFQSFFGCPRRLSDSAFPRVDEPAGCLV